MGIDSSDASPGKPSTGRLCVLAMGVASLALAACDEHEAPDSGQEPGRASAPLTAAPPAERPSWPVFDTPEGPELSREQMSDLNLVAGAHGAVFIGVVRTGLVGEQPVTGTFPDGTPTKLTLISAEIAGKVLAQQQMGVNSSLEFAVNSTRPIFKPGTHLLAVLQPTPDGLLFLEEFRVLASPEVPLDVEQLLSEVTP